MTERKTLIRHAPVRLRFRSPIEQLQWEREHIQPVGVEGLNGQAKMTSLSNVSETQRRTQQVKELVRLGNLLRAELGLHEVLQQVVASISSCTGFRRLVINLIDEQTNNLLAVAFAGLTEEEENKLRSSPMSLDLFYKVTRAEFRRSQSYFISHEHVHLLEGMTMIIKQDNTVHEAGKWHPEDGLFVPLFSPRERRLLGVLSLDDPEDGKVPTVEGIEMVELFANQAAIAIDNAILFQERDAERVALEEGIMRLREDMEQIRHGDLRQRVRPTHEKLQPIGEAINTMLDAISGVMGKTQTVTQAIDEHMRNVQHSSEYLMRDANQQKRQVDQITVVVNEIAAMTGQIAERTNTLSLAITEAVEVANMAQEAVDRAVEGMSKVREATMQSSRTMKSLSERGQGMNETILAVTELSTRLHHTALNAAIEATRSGEAGKGFAVVAQEIRALANSSSEAARNINAYIRSIQQETSVVAQSIEQNTQQVVMQTELVTQTNLTLETVSDVTQNLKELAQSICAAVESQTQSSQTVVGSVLEIDHMSDEITRHMREMHQTMGRLSALIESLRKRMSVFRITVSNVSA